MPTPTDFLNEVNKNYKTELILGQDKTKSMKKKRFSTGVFHLDLQIGGGWLYGHNQEIAGPESCLEASTYISYVLESKNQNTQPNTKGGTIEKLYERFKKDSTGIYVKSVNHENCIIRNQVLDVVKTGIKPCYRVKTKDGQLICSTLEHKYMTPDGFKELSTLKVGDLVFVHNNTRVKGRKKDEWRPDVCVKYHPKLPTKIIEKKYLYYRGQLSRLVYEAYINGFEYSKYIEFLNTASKEEIDKLQFLPNNIHIHHEDENFRNNSIENLRLISPKEHGLLHAKDRIKNLSFIAVTTEIISIEKMGNHVTYDIKCAYPYNNYIANQFVVHNSGKTLLAIKAMQSIANYCRCRKTLASCDCGKKEPSKTLYVDAEGTLDLDWVQTCGANLDLMYYVRPQYGEQASDIINKAILENTFDLIILDSLDSLLPLKSIEGSIEDGQRMAARAALVGDSLRKWNMSRLQLAKEDSPALITLNQLREKPTIYGNPWYMPGGNAQKFYHDIILWLTKGKSEDDSASGETGKMLLGGKTEKNKTFKPKMEFAFYLALENSDLYKKGQIQNIEQLFDLGKKYNLIIKDKGWNFNNEVIAPNGEEFQALLKSSGKGPKLWRSILNHVCGYSNISENVLG